MYLHSSNTKTRARRQWGHARMYAWLCTCRRFFFSYFHGFPLNKNAPHCYTESELLFSLTVIHKIIRRTGDANGKHLNVSLVDGYMKTVRKSWGTFFLSLFPARLLGETNDVVSTLVHRSDQFHPRTEILFHRTYTFYDIHIFVIMALQLNNLKLSIAAY